MNHIYKSIFNKALGVFTAVPEFASAHGKGSERTVVGRVAKGTAGFAASALAISVGLALTSTSAVAYPGIYVNDRQAGNCLAINDSAIANVGVGTILDVNTAPGTVQLRVPGTFALQTGTALSHYNAAGSARPCVAVGGSTVDNRDTQTNRTLFYGGPGAATEADEVNNENNGAKNLTLGGRLDVNSGIIGVGDRGTNGAGATNSIRMGMGTALSDANKQVDAITIGVNAGASAKHATAIGSATTAKTGYSTALGFQAQAGDPAVINFNGEYATAIGGKAKALHAYTTALGAETNASGAYATAVGNEAKATKESTTAVGDRAKATNDFATAIGHMALASGKNGTAVGTRNEALGEEATAIGYHSHANGSQQLSIGAHAGRNLDGSFSQSTHGISIGSLAGADNATAKSNDDSVLIGTESGRYAQGGNRNTSIGKSAGQYLNGNDNIAMGSNAGSGTAAEKLQVSRTTAIGNTAKALTNDSVAIGTEAKSGKADKFSGERSVAIGAKAEALGTGGIAIGDNAATTDGHNSVAIGVYSKTQNEKAISIGAFNTASGVQSIVIAGNYDTKGSKGVSTATATRATVIGAETNVSGEQSVAIGDKNDIASARTYALGNNINVKAGADDALAFGTKAAVGGANAIALGNTASAAINNAIAVGQASSSTGNSAIAIGTKASAQGDSAVAHGVEAQAIAQSSTAIGFRAKAQGYEQISIGSNAGNSSPANAENYGAVFIGRHAGSGNNSATGNTDGVSIGSNAGQNAVSGIKNVAIGPTTGQNVEGNQNLALSTNAGNNVKGDNNLAMMVGAGNNIEGGNNIAIGTNANSGTPTAKRVVTNSIAMGANTQATSNGTIAIGPQARALAADAVALGLGSLSNHANSVALGAGSVTSAPHTGDYTLNNSYTAAGLPNAANGTVSVGYKDKERQIQNVAAGVISKTSTDAINGSQLYATNNYINNFAVGVKNVLGGDAAVDNAGNVTMSNIGDTGKGTVHDAIKSLKDSINAKADTTASVTSENAADIKVEKEAPVGNITNYKLSLGDDAKAKLAKAETALQTVEGDSNITATKDPADPTKVKLALNKDLTADSLTLGDKAGEHAVVNKDGLTIANGPSVKKDGINAGNKRITGVADGNVAAGSKDAVNGGQLAEVKAKADSAVQNVVSANPTALTVTKAGDTVTLTPNFIAGDLVNPATGEVNTPAADDAGKLVTAGTVAKALAETHFVVDTKATTGGELDGASQANQKIKSSNKVTLQAGKNLKAKQTNGTDGAQVEFSLKDSISLTQVTAGTGDNQVVLGKDGVQVGGNTYINKDGINAAGKAISNVANGNVAAYSKDAVNGGQLHDTAKSMADVIGGGATVKDGKVVAGQNGIGNTGQNTVHGAIAAINQNTANNFNQIRGDLRKMDRDLRGSIAGTLATAGLPQAFTPGKSMVAAAASTHRGQSGLAIGVSRISDNGKVILKVTGNTNSRGDFGGTIGAGYQW